MSDRDISDFGHEKTRSARAYYGWCVLTPSLIKSVQLILDPDNNPERHANIRGWAEPHEGDRKDQNKQKAQQLAELASSVTPPTA